MPVYIWRTAEITEYSRGFSRIRFQRILNFSVVRLVGGVDNDVGIRYSDDD
jgi:hypothetical protein